MTPEAQRIAIAEACGWKYIKSKKRWDAPNGGWDYVETLPDYLSDLNAMHEAEKVLYADGHDSDRACDYRANLVICADAGMSSSATAAQRAEAFLRLHGKWNSPNQ